MKSLFFRQLPKLLPLAALFLASGIAQAAQPPRVMFVSGVEAQPVLIDLQGREIPAKKGAIIPPGFSVKVPEGATMQIMTDEKAIVAVRQNSLLKLEKLGDGNDPHKFKLDNGGLRVANSDKKPHKFEVDTPNAKITFDRGDHEAYYLQEGKIPEKWGTFVRPLKEDSVLTTATGDAKVTPRDYGYVPGTGSGKPELFARLDTSGRGYVDPVSFTLGSKPDVVRKMRDNQDALSGKDPIALDPGGPRSLQPKGYAPPEIIGKLPGRTPLPGVMPKPDILTRLDPKSVPDPNLMRQLKVGTSSTGDPVVFDLRPNSVGVVSKDPGKSVTFTRTELETIKDTGKPPPVAIKDVKVTCSGRSCF